MKTKELIERLKELDPEGNLVVDSVWLVERLPGYYDGPAHEFINGKFHINYFPEKLRIINYSLEDYIWDGGIDVIMDKEDTRTRETVNKIKKEYEEFEKAQLKEFTIKVYRKLLEGYKIYQDKGKSDKMYNSSYYKKGKEIIRLMQGECAVLIKSGLFKLIGNKWELIN